MATVECYKCHEFKPLESFWKDNAAVAHSFVKYYCKDCMRSERAEARHNRPGAALVGSGVSIHAGNGVKAPMAIVAPPGYTRIVEAAPTRERDLMSFSEWVSLAQAPSVFVADGIAVLFTGDQFGTRYELLTTSGAGPHEPTTAAMTAYLMRLLTSQEADAVVGLVYY